MDHVDQKFGVSIDRRIFNIEDQHQFARFSGDFNPIHIDPIQARRTIAGECIVHGINSLMYAINSLTKYTELTINYFNVKFINSIPLGIEVQYFWDENKKKLSIVGENKVYISIFFALGSILKDDDISAITSAQPLPTPRNITLEDCSQINREDLMYRGTIEEGKLLFPEFIAKYGNVIAAELAATSEIVGMQTPGLNSLFLSIKGNLGKKNVGSYYEVASCDLRFGLVKLLIMGRSLKAEIEAIYRPHLKNSPSTAQISKIIKPNEFENVNALIIGGSRGLGEITAKIITCGGGKVTVSYNLGEADAQKLQVELLNFGGKCEIVKLNIQNKFFIPENYFNQIYYFATPKIKDVALGGSSDYLTQLYEIFYVYSFHKLLNQVLENNIQASVFYPSSAFLNNDSTNFAAYINAKLKGELLCKEFIETKSMKIVYPRLPRLATDQTLGIVPEEFEDSVNVMYPFIQSMLC